MEFEDGIVTAENWFRQSMQMYEASKVLYESLKKTEVATESDTFRKVGSMKGAMLLLGIAAENALKGAHVYKLRPDLSKRKLDPNHFNDNRKYHDLIGIADKLGYSMSDEMKECLERLTIFVTWASKYQSAINEDAHQQATGKFKLNYPKDYILVMDLIKELQAQSGHEVHNGWQLKSQ